MTQNIVAYFCGTGYYTGEDACYQALRLNLVRNTTLFGYDGCQVHGGGIFAFGVEEHADAFIADLKQHLAHSEDWVQLNLVGHSRGSLSALLVVKKIHEDPELIKRCSITAELRDPVTGNFQMSNHIAGGLTLSNQIKDMRPYPKLQKVFITLNEVPLLHFAFDAIIPQFSLNTQVEVEVIPGYHDVQQRTVIDAEYEHKAIFDIGIHKTLSILAKDGNNLDIEEHSLVEEQISAYERLIPWIKSRIKPIIARTLHGDGKIIANKRSIQDITAINWRHAALMEQVPGHVLFANTHSYYNYRKTLMEFYCDLTLALDDYLVQHPNQEVVIEELRHNAAAYCRGERDLATFRTAVQNILTLSTVDEKRLNTPLNFILFNSLFASLDKTIAENVPSTSPLYENLMDLKLHLCEELCAEIETGKSTQDLMRSKILKIIRETDNLLNNVYSGTLNADEIIEVTDAYLKKTVNPAYQWHIGSKIVFGALLTLGIGIVSAILGAVVGFGLGVIIGAATGPGVIVFALTAAFISAIEISFIAVTATTASIGLGVGVWQTVSFFKPSAIELSIENMADTLIDEPLMQP